MAVRVLLVVLCAILGPVPGTAHGAQPHREVAAIHDVARAYAYDDGRIAPTPRLARVGRCTCASDAAPIALGKNFTSGGGRLRTSAHDSDAPKATRGTTTLYRAVGPAELAHIQKTGKLVNLGSAEGKYFTTQAEAASSYARQAVKGFGDPPYTMVSTEIPTSAITPVMRATVDRGVPAVVVPDALLPGLVPRVHTSMPIPPGPWR